MKLNQPPTTGRTHREFLPDHGQSEPYPSLAVRARNGRVADIPGLEESPTSRPRAPSADFPTHRRDHQLRAFLFERGMCLREDAIEAADSYAQHLRERRCATSSICFGVSGRWLSRSKCSALSWADRFLGRQLRRIRLACATNWFMVLSGRVVCKKDTKVVATDTGSHRDYLR